MNATHRTRYTTRIVRTTHQIEIFEQGTARSLKDAVLNLPDNARVLGIDTSENDDVQSVVLTFVIETPEPKPDEGNKA